VTDGRFVTTLGGKGANQAAAAAALGAEVHFVGCVGDDEHGALIRADLAARAVECRGLVTHGSFTGVALIMVGGRGENVLAVAPAVVVTLGGDGAVLYRRDHEPRPQPAFAVDAVDTTGAGDAFNGALAWALAQRRELREAIRLACAAGALATRAVGARASL